MASPLHVLVGMIQYSPFYSKMTGFAERWPCLTHAMQIDYAGQLLTPCILIDWINPLNPRSVF